MPTAARILPNMYLTPTNPPPPHPSGAAFAFRVKSLEWNLKISREDSITERQIETERLDRQLGRQTWGIGLAEVAVKSSEIWDFLLFF